jgi:hypothetical protein
MFVLQPTKNQRFFSTSFSAPNRNILLNNRACGAFIFGLFRIFYMAPDIDLDANATSPVLPAAIAAAIEAMAAPFGNPSSSHAAGQTCGDLLVYGATLAMRCA